MIINFLKRLTAVLVTVAGMSAVAVPGYASDHAGIHHYNVTVCGREYVPVTLGHGDYFNVYNAQSNATCVSSERRHLAWSVPVVSHRSGAWLYPNISSGIEWGRYTCDDGPSASVSARGSRCMRYPVREKNDGTPLTSVTFWPHLTVGNVAYDIWFNKERVAPQRLHQNDGAEIMIWLMHPGLPVWNACWRARIQGRSYDVMCWTAHHHHKSWHYIAYVAVRQTRALPQTWLNPFFRDAIRHRKLSPYWWLTSINFGEEMARGGQGFAVHSYSLRYVKLDDDAARGGGGAREGHTDTVARAGPVVC
jgi:hypothetical protein